MYSIYQCIYLERDSQLSQTNIMVAASAFTTYSCVVCTWYLLCSTYVPRRSARQQTSWLQQHDSGKIAEQARDWTNQLLFFLSDPADVNCTGGKTLPLLSPLLGLLSFSIFPLPKSSTSLTEPNCRMDRKKKKREKMEAAPAAKEHGSIVGDGEEAQKGKEGQNKEWKKNNTTKEGVYSRAIERDEVRSKKKGSPSLSSLSRYWYYSSKYSQLLQLVSVRIGRAVGLSVKE